jgi:hypothetical protein
MHQPAQPQPTIDDLRRQADQLLRDVRIAYRRIELSQARSGRRLNRWQRDFIAGVRQIERRLYAVQTKIEAISNAPGDGVPLRSTQR